MGGAGGVPSYRSHAYGFFSSIAPMLSVLTSSIIPVFITIGMVQRPEFRSTLRMRRNLQTSLSRLSAWTREKMMARPKAARPTPSYHVGPVSAPCAATAGTGADNHGKNRQAAVLRRR
ncbi:hypothetical protein ACFU76_19700 [Streptomyces sp. NPDC057539]|uniref:hypothetical protein n=1 Tax=Streptomyces sp. NPDC057539 TaxID=3346159 RepID=UPI00367A8EF1